METPLASAEDGHDSEAFQIFVCLWCQMRLYRLITFIGLKGYSFIDYGKENLAGALTAVAAISCLAAPSSAGFGVMLIAFLIWAWNALPYDVDNGGTFELLVNSNIFAGLCWAWANNADPMEGIVACGPGVRTAMIMMYSFAVLAKCNVDYMEPRRSGATVFIIAVLEMFAPFLKCGQHAMQHGKQNLGTPLLRIAPESERIREAAEPLHPNSVFCHLLLFYFHANLWLILVFEGLVPLLLASGAIYHGMLLCWFLHFGLGLIAIDYSSIMMACLAFWMPIEQLYRLHFITLHPIARVVAPVLAIALVASLQCKESCRNFISWCRATCINVFSRFVLVASCASICCAMILLGSFHVFCIASAIVLVCIFLIGLVALFAESAHGAIVHAVACLWELCLLPALYAGHPRDLLIYVLPRSTSCIDAFDWFVIALTFLNGFGPYLGYKTHSTWSMFSNLRVEAKRTNHVFLSPSWAPCEYLRDCVEIIATDVPALRGYHRCTPLCAPTCLQVFVDQIGIDLSVHGNSATGLACDPLKSGIMPYVVPYIMLRRIVSLQAMPELHTFFVEYVRDGKRQRFEVRNGELSDDSDPHLAKPPSWLIRKFVFLRSQPSWDDRTPCNH